MILIQTYVCMTLERVLYNLIKLMFNPVVYIWQ
jgi:hypothetical protein